MSDTQFLTSKYSGCWPTHWSEKGMKNSFEKDLDIRRVASIDGMSKIFIILEFSKLFFLKNASSTYTQKLNNQQSRLFGNMKN